MWLDAFFCENSIILDLGLLNLENALQVVIKDFCKFHEFSVSTAQTAL